MNFIQAASIAVNLMGKAVLRDGRWAATGADELRHAGDSMDEKDEQVPHTTVTLEESPRAVTP